jgi:uncharacterized protein
MDNIGLSLFIAGVSCVATIISSMSGAGATMITTPVWLMLGFPLPVAITSTTVNGSVWTLLAARNYLKGCTVDWRQIAGFICVGFLGAFWGTQAIMRTDPHIVQRIIGVIILSLVAFTWWRRDFGIEASEPKASRTVTSLAALPLGFYESFFGAGNGIFTSTLLATARGLTLLEALGYYYCISFVWCVFSASLYISAGNWNATLMIPSALGSIVGASIGSKIGKAKGTRFVKAIFITVGTVLAIKLLVGL